MPNFKLATLTKKGIALITKVNSGNGNIQFTKAAAGAGTYASSEDLSSVTELKDQRQTFEFTKKQIRNENTVVLRVVMDNKDLTTGYEVNEFGLFANDPDEGEILYSIATAVSGQADFMPSYSGGNATSMTVDSYVTVASASTVQVTISSGNYVTQDDLDSSIESITVLFDGKIEELSQKKQDKYTEKSVNIPMSGWTESDPPFTNTVQIEGVTETNDISVIPNFDWTQEQAEAWAGAMIMSASQAEGSVTLKAYGDKPTMDLTVTVLIGDEVKEGA